MSTFDVLEHASLRRAIPRHRVLGWGAMLVGVAGLIALLAVQAEYEAVVALPEAVLFAAFLWLAVYRGRLRSALEVLPWATESETFEARPAVRSLTAPIVAASLIVAYVVVDNGTPPVFAAFALGICELGAAAHFRRWERRHGRTLYADQRKQLYER